MTSLGYLGPIGTYSELAAQKYCAQQTQDITTTPYSSFFNLFEALTANQCDSILIPLENSIGGSIAAVLDLLTYYDNITITAEYTMPIDCCLFSKPGIQVNDITDIVSHPQPISQCAQYLHKNYPNAILHQASSTTDAVRILEDNPTKNMAVIGHHHLADLYQLQLLAESIQDNPNNVTRFGLISTTPAPKQTETKTSVVCAPKHDQPGSLYTLLSHFNERQVNLTKITSRPTKNKLGEYMFFIDYDTPDLDHNETLLSNLKQYGSYFQHLGSYPQFTLD